VNEPKQMALERTKPRCYETQQTTACKTIMDAVEQDSCLWP
jgi:hypothetical protein